MAHVCKPSSSGAVATPCSPPRMTSRQSYGARSLTSVSARWRGTRKKRHVSCVLAGRGKESLQGNVALSPASASALRRCIKAASCQLSSRITRYFVLRGPLFPRAPRTSDASYGGDTLVFFLWQGETLAMFFCFLFLSLRFPFFVLRVPAIPRRKGKRWPFF